jgi:hypothetical protein
MPVDITLSARKRKFRIPCPYANCRRRFKSQRGATYHKRTKHQSWEPLALDAISESDQSVPLLHDEPSDFASSELPDSDSDSSVSLASSEATHARGYDSGDLAMGEDSKQDEGGSDPPQLDDNNWAIFEDDQDGGSSPDRPHLGSDLPDPGLDTLGGDDLTNPWTEDFDTGDEEAEMQTCPSTYHRRREYHSHLTGEY